MFEDGLKKLLIGFGGVSLEIIRNSSMRVYHVACRQLLLQGEGIQCIETFICNIYDDFRPID